VNVPLPYERLVIETRLTPQQVAERLREATAPNSRVARRSSASDKGFQGIVSDREFRITPVIRYNNAFLPLIRGQIDDAPDGARVSVSMRLAPAIFGFMLLWFGFLTPVVLAIVVVAAITQTFSPFFLVPFGLFAFGYALTTGSFKFESRPSRERLEAILSADETTQAMPTSDWTARLRGINVRVDVRWSDVRTAGPLGFAWVALYAVAAALSLYDWMIRQAGCTNQQAGDPTYACPSGARVFAVWTVLAAVMATSALGIWPILRRRPRWLIPVLLAQIVVIVVLVWIARDPAFHARHR
jgi:hypothetical protein